VSVRVVGAHPNYAGALAALLGAGCLPSPLAGLQCCNAASGGLWLSHVPLP
jgi:hypothetical protein